MTEQIIQLPEMPSTLPAYRRAVTTAFRRKGGAVSEVPPIRLRLDAVEISSIELNRYLAVCGFPDEAGIPITYPQVLAGPMHMHLMSRPEFPLPMMGLVHVGNEIEQLRPLVLGESLDFDVHVGESRQVKRGLEFDLLTEASSGDEVVWRSTMTILRITRKGSGGKRDAVAPEVAVSRYRTVNAPADIGRRYAKVSGDYNPIHISAASARLFGFPRAIAHGMWTLARCVGLMSDQLQTDPTKLSVRFKQPLLLPGKAALRYGSGESLHFTLIGSQGRVHLEGDLR